MDASLYVFEGGFEGRAFNSFFAVFVLLLEGIEEMDQVGEHLAVFVLIR